MDDKYKELMQMARDYAKAAAFRREMQLITAEAENKELMARCKFEDLCNQLREAATNRE